MTNTDIIFSLIRTSSFLEYSPSLLVPYSPSCIHIMTKNNLTNSVVTLSIEYAIYIPLFALLFYIDNRQRYIDPLTGKKYKNRIKSDIKKLIAAFSISELIFSFAKIAIHYELLQTYRVEPYQASMVGSLAAWAIFLVSINLSVKAVKLFRSQK
jgi:hypothetical protein